MARGRRLWHKARIRSRLIVACSLTIALGGRLEARQNAEPTALEVLARLDAYFDDLPAELGRLVAEERLVQ